MEKVLIEQLLHSGVSLKKIKTIIENTEKIKEQNLNETVSANTCGLNLVVCSGCHKTMYEDKFMLNKANKRYRSCINCVSRARTARQNKEQKHVLKNTDNDKVLAILDTDYINIDDDVVQGSDDIIIVKPNNDKVLRINNLNSKIEKIKEDIYEYLLLSQSK